MRPVVHSAKANFLSDDQPVTLDRRQLRRGSFRAGGRKPDCRPCRFRISCARTLDEFESRIPWRFVLRRGPLLCGPASCVTISSLLPYVLFPATGAD